jgi:hypothetical protein
MRTFFRGPATFFRRLENSNYSQRNDNFFQKLIMDCSRAIHLILGTYLLPIFRYPLPRPRMDFFIPASRSRSSCRPAKCTQIFSKHTQKFRRQTQIFRTHATIFRTYTTFFRTQTKIFRRLTHIFRSHATKKMEHLLIAAAASFPPYSPAMTVLHGSGPPPTLLLKR